MDTILKEGVQLYRENRYEDALAAFLKISSKDTELNFDLAYYIGLCYASLLQYDNALVYLEQIITAGTDIARVYQCRLILAFIYTKTGRVRLAEFELSKLLDAGYDSPQVHTSMAYLAYEQEKVDKALELYEKALELDPDNSTALNGLGYILADTEKDLTRALILCKKALDAQPDNPAYLDSLAWTYYKMGFDTEARTYIQRADAQLPDNEIIKRHLQRIMSS
ncbi:tetratricopeptide repeat protein [Treponema vincentii]|uniref:tetratricopeptide repeat protein n=1 Tax=Treponema TaxID=157 RepID=UPI001BB0C81A|nr:tetratricopeptide repeat protein [Treponema vincentii]QUY18226.1 tetratricopeptide repeat protein [Treponema vincentii]